MSRSSHGLRHAALVLQVRLPADQQEFQPFMNKRTVDILLSASRETTQHHEFELLDFLEDVSWIASRVDVNGSELFWQNPDGPSCLILACLVSFLLLVI